MKRVGTVLILAITAWFTAVAEPYAFRRRLNVDRVAEEHGVTMGSVRHIIQDRLGFIWVATANGLFKFDGYEFQVFRAEPFNPYSIVGNNITELVEDKQDTLWIVADGSLCRYDREENKFFRYPSGQEEGGLMGRPHQIFCDRQGTIWIATGDQGLYRFEPQTSRFHRYHHILEESNSLSHNRVTAIYQDRVGQLWIATENGLNKYRVETDDFERFLVAEDMGFGIGLGPHLIPRTLSCEGPIQEDEDGHLWIMTSGGGLVKLHILSGEETRYRHQPGNENSLAGNFLKAVYHDTSGRIWAVTSNGVLNLYEPKTDQFRQFQAQGGRSFGIPDFDSGHVNFSEDSEGRLWISSRESGLAVYLPDLDLFRRFRHDPLNRFSLSDDQITCLFMDRSQNLWIGNESGGLDRYGKYRRKFGGFTHEPGRFESLPRDHITAAADADNNRYWLGTANSGLLLFHETTAVVERAYVADGHDARSISNNQITALAKDGEGRLWVGTRKGLNRMYENGDGFYHYRAAAGIPFGLDDGRINALFTDSRGRLWIGTQGRFLQYYDPEVNGFRRLALPDSAGFMGGGITSFAEDQFGHLWIGREHAGLVRYGLDDLQMREFRHDLTRPEGLSHDNISTVFIDTNGNLWVGTLGGGLNLYDWDTDHFRHFTSDSQGFSGNQIYGMLQDRNGTLWLSMHNGLTAFDPINGEVSNYDTGDGLVPHSSHGAAFIRDSGGRVLYGGRHGFNLFRPDQLTTNPNPPPIVVSTFSKLNVVAERDLVDGDHIELTFAENTFSVELAALDFTYPAKNRYEIKLEGFDRDWIAKGNTRTAAYTNLDGGRYTLRVRASNNDGVWNEEGIAVNIRVSPPFFKTTWFYLLIGGLILFLIAGAFVAQRLRLQKAQNEALLSLELQRKTEELEYARRIQLSMLPDRFPDDTSIEVWAQMRTATEVGGDYYDFMPLEDGKLCLAVGDATGHGFAAGLVVGMTKMGATVWSMGRDRGIRGMIEELNSGLKKSLTERTMGMSFGVALYDYESSEVQMAFAGMPFPYHFRAADGRLIPLVMKAPPLGFLRKITVQTQSVTLAPDDYLIFLSDGFGERFNPDDQMWGRADLEETLRQICFDEDRAAAVAERFFEACDRFAEGRPNDDDMTIVVLRKKA